MTPPNCLVVMGKWVNRYWNLTIIMYILIYSSNMHMEELLHSLYHSARIRLGDDMVIIYT